MNKCKLHIDTEKGIYTIDGKDIGTACTCVEIKITPVDFPEVTLHMVPDMEADVYNCNVQRSNEAIDAAADSNPPIVETSVS